MRSTQIGQSTFQSVPDNRQRAKQADNAARGHRARTDVEDISIAHIVRSHVGNWHFSRRNNADDMVAKKFDRGNQYEI